jgi:NAD(P)-dependent dehydrogenase (short-subunit alcohol dehydrogenase family)
MDLSLTDKAAIVTGGSRRFGRAIRLWRGLRRVILSAAKNLV